MEEQPPKDERAGYFNRLFAFLTKANVSFLHSQSPQEIYEKATNIAVRDGDVRLCWAGIIDENDQTLEPVAYNGADDGFLNSVRFSTLEVPDGMGPPGRAVRTGRPEVCNDIENSSDMPSQRSQALKRSFHSCAAFPLIVNEEIIGTLNFYSETAGFFDEENMKLFEVLTANTSTAIERLKADEERKAAEENLRRSERHFRRIIENTSDIVFILDADGVVRYVSPSIQRMLGYKRSDVRDRRISDFIESSDAGTLLSLHSEVIGKQDVARGVMFGARHSDGTIRMLEAVLKGFRGEENEPLVVVNARDVTEKTIADKRLRESEETSRALLNATGEIFFLIETTGVIETSNERGARIFGGHAGEVRGMNVFEKLPPDASSKWRDRCEEVIKIRKPIKFEGEMLSRVFENSIFPVFDADGNVSRLAINLHDITELRKVEEAQSKDRDFIMAVLNTTDALVIVLDTDGRIVMMNKTCEETSGFLLKELRGRILHDVLAVPDEVEQLDFAFEQLAKSGQTTEFELNLLTKDKRKRLINWLASSLYGNNGTPEFIIMTGIDITERRLAEIGLRESEGRYRMIFESTRSALCIVESDETISFVNKEFERLTGWDAESIQGKKKVSNFILPEDLAVFKGCHRRALSEGQIEPIYFECRMGDASGKVIQTLGSVGPMPGLTSIVVSLIDITREKEYEQELREKAERLRHFLTVASHELRHPITVIKGYANTLVEYMESMPEEMINEILKDIDSSTGKLTHLVNELMDVSKIEEGETFVRKERTDVEALVSSVVEEFKASGYKNEVETRIGESVASAQLDSERIGRVFGMLLENAAKYSSASSPIEIEVEKGEDFILFSVLDRGVGVPESEREKIFDRFYQVTDALHHSIPGIGLGLYISREIITAHGGEIWHEPRDGGGSIFRFKIPCSQVL
ncbi:MAG: PAS domain S-box protein [Actinomycetota bacterium]|nr:PAS domain S-box protein [Actinomycetota bacterium]